MRFPEPPGSFPGAPLRRRSEAVAERDHHVVFFQPGKSGGFRAGGSGAENRQRQKHNRHFTRLMIHSSSRTAYLHLPSFQYYHVRTFCAQLPFRRPVGKMLFFSGIFYGTEKTIKTLRRLRNV
jgi:hypothetical protein